jgi:hypothetical protein
MAAVDPAYERKSGERLPTYCPEHIEASSVDRTSTNVDFLPDLAPLENGAIFFLLHMGFLW